MIWLIGSKGMLGSEIARQLTQNKIPWIGTNSDIDITNYQALESFEKTLETSAYYPSQLPHAQRKVQWIINCAGYTNVDQAEEDIETCNKINVLGAQNIARLCRNIGCKLIHISTDYIFDGKSDLPYTEEAVPNPQNVYGKSKLQAEIEISKLMNTYYIIRTSWLYGTNGKNFVKTMIDLMNTNSEIKVVNDQKGCPTNSADLAEAILKLIEKSESATSLFGKNSAPNFGIYNYSNGGETTWFDFAQAINKFGKKYGKIEKDCNVISCTSEDFVQKALRPSYSVLNKDKISKALKIKIPGWESSLEKYLRGK